MIPKKIHLCWLSGETYPDLVKQCIESWRAKLPDYEIVLWDTHRFNCQCNNWCKSAWTWRKYAFVSDYIRFYALYVEGGIYFDSDVEVLKSFDELLHYRSFIGFENCSNMIEPAVMGAEKGEEWCKHILDIYDSLTFPEDRLPYELIAPKIVTRVLKEFCPDYPTEVPTTAILSDSGLLFCPPDWFSPLKESSKQVFSNKYKQDVTPNTYAIHHFNGSWTKYSMLIKMLRSMGLYHGLLDVWKRIRK